MPGIIVFQRRWGVGSDDLVVPGISLTLLHTIWLIVVAVTLCVNTGSSDNNGSFGVQENSSNNNNSISSSGSSSSSGNSSEFVTLNETLATSTVDAAGSSNESFWSALVAGDGVIFVSDEGEPDADHACNDVQLLVIKAVLLFVALLLEITMAGLALRGTMRDVHPRRFMEYVLYGRLLVLVAEVVWCSFGIVWLHGQYITCPAGVTKGVLLGSVICDLCVAVSVLITIWCTFDRAGRSWVKMTRFQRSMKEGETKYHYKRSGTHRPNWRQRKVMRTYQDTWNHRCKILFCCMGRSDQYKDSFSEIARLLTDFFRDLDLVPTDIVAGLVLLRKQQKKLQETLVNQDQNDIYEFLSGVAVTSKTRFLELHEPDQLEAFQLTAHYMKFALAAYGWPMYLLGHSKTGLCRLVSHIRCCCCAATSGSSSAFNDGENLPVVVGDTCSGCHLAALKQSIGRGDYQVIFASFHVDVSETPFFVAVDYDHQSVVVSIRGTISMKDVITDLHAEAEPIPLQLTRDDWFGHKGMVQTASYIRNKLEKENLLGQAFAHNPERGTPDFRLVLVGHSLGAGTAAILALLLRHEYPHVHCYAYSPPGGLLSLPAAEFTKEFVTSVVVGKDVVPRLGLHQLETLRSSLMTAINKSTESKWKILGSSMMCCGRRKDAPSKMSSSSPVVSIEDGGGGSGSKDVPSTAAVLTKHPSDTNISLSTHQPLYPPGRIIHIVRQHPKTSGRSDRSSGGCSATTREHQTDPIYQALWADTIDFNEVLISPVMVHDHMPDTVLRALNKVLSCYGPSIPQRVTSELLLKSDQADYQPGLIVDGSLLMAATPSPVSLMVQRPFLENTSLTSIDRSPTLGHRPSVDRGEAPLSGSVPLHSFHLLHQPSWLMPQVRRATTSNLPAMSVAGWNFNPLQHYPSNADELFLEYTNCLVAPIATPETMSEESAGGSISSLAKRAHKFLRRERASSASANKKKDAAAPQHYSCSSSDIYEMTESSSVYCASPLSSARTTSGQTRASRAQLKREIMRLYQRAAADVDKVDTTMTTAAAQQAEQPSDSVSSQSRSASISSPSQPSRLFPVLDPMSPVFGVRNGSSSNSGNQSRYAISPVTSRPATANGGTGRRLSASSRPTLPPCNTSF